MSKAKKLGHLSKPLTDKQKFKDLLETVGYVLALPILQGEPEMMVKLRDTIGAELRTASEVFLNHKSVDTNAAVKLLEMCEALEAMHERMSQGALRLN